MKYSVYAVKDELVGFMQPFILQNDQQALRSFEATVNATDGNPIARAYKDMSFYRLGTFDDSTGKLTSDVQMLASGASVCHVPCVESAPVAQFSDDVSGDVAPVEAVSADTEVAEDFAGIGLTRGQLSAIQNVLKKKEVKAR